LENLIINIYNNIEINYFTPYIWKRIKAINQNIESPENIKDLVQYILLQDQGISRKITLDRDLFQNHLVILVEILERMKDIAQANLLDINKEKIRRFMSKISEKVLIIYVSYQY